MNDRHAAAWPDIHVSGWLPTKISLHLYAQMLGKLRVALSPPQPNWLFTALSLSARGLTTGFIPWNGGAIEARIDVFSSEIVIDRSDGERRCVALLPARCVADVFADVRTALSALDIACTLSPIPQELADTTPFHEDRRVRAYDPVAAQRWFAAATAAAGVFEDWRSHFFGRTAIALWWGGLDVAVLLFSGKHVAAPTDRGYIMKYDLDAELMNVGFYVGDDTTAPFFFGYIYPQPPGAEQLPIAPAGASWSAQLGEWILPYEAVRTSAAPEREVRAFLDRIYTHCVSVAGWDPDAYRYAIPPRPRG